MQYINSANWPRLNPKIAELTRMTGLQNVRINPASRKPETCVLAAFSRNRQLRGFLFLKKGPCRADDPLGGPLADAPLRGEFR
jgi:hypothetical protein